MSTVHASYPLSTKTRLEIVEGNLTQAPVEVIVNAANEHLKHGAGIAAAIVRDGGWSVQQESDEWVRKHGPVSHTEPAYTKAGTLPYRYVIHAVGPVWGSGDEDAKLAGAIRGALRRADELGLHSIAFPAISTGIFGFPKDRAARINFETFQRYFAEMPDTGITLVQLILWKGTLEIFLEEGRRAMGKAE